MLIGQIETAASNFLLLSMSWRCLDRCGCATYRAWKERNGSDEPFPDCLRPKEALITLVAKPHAGEGCELLLQL